jgi:hypothetical protein
MFCCLLLGFTCSGHLLSNTEASRFSMLLSRASLRVTRGVCRAQSVQTEHSHHREGIPLLGTACYCVHP